MKRTFLVCIAVSLLPAVMQPANAVEFDCKRTSETTQSRQNDRTPHETRFKIDLRNEIVTEIDGCMTTTYSNASDADATGSDNSKCPPPKYDPGLEKLERDPRLSGLFSGPQRHALHDEVYHVTITPDSTEWGLESREQSWLSRLDRKTNVMSYTMSCHNCIAAWWWTATYQCRKVSR